MEDYIDSSEENHVKDNNLLESNLLMILESCFLNLIFNLSWPWLLLLALQIWQISSHRSSPLCHIAVYRSASCTGKGAGEGEVSLTRLEEIDLLIHSSSLFSRSAVYTSKFAPRRAKAFFFFINHQNFHEISIYHSIFATRRQLFYQGLAKRESGRKKNFAQFFFYTFQAILSAFCEKIIGSKFKPPRLQANFGQNFFELMRTPICINLSLAITRYFTPRLRQENQKVGELFWN